MDSKIFQSPLKKTATRDKEEFLFYFFLAYVSASIKIFGNS